MEKFKINVEPTDKQKQLLQSVLLYDRTFYGGSAGGGKSYGAMWVAGILLDMYPGVVIRAIRETYTAVEQNLVSKFQEIYPEKNQYGERIYKYNKSDNVITWHNGSKLIFDYELEVYYLAVLNQNSGYEKLFMGCLFPHSICRNSLSAKREN